MALQDMLAWLDDEEWECESDDSDKNTPDLDASANSGPTITKDCFHDRIAIFDATNSTDKRRRWLLEQCTSPELRSGKPTGMIFVESFCDDQELLNENFRFKISNSPDYAGMREEDAMADLKERCQKYEEQYETITDDSLSYIKMFNLSTKMLVNHIYGRMAKVIVPALMAWNIGTRPIFLCRTGQTLHDITTDGEDYVSRVNWNDPRFATLSKQSRRVISRGDSLGEAGKKFSDALYDFVCEECTDFLLKRTSTMDMAHTGTSKTGLAPGPSEHRNPRSPTPKHTNANMEPVRSPRDNDSREPPFPLHIYTSTMPRALETCRWEDDYDFRMEELSNLNPLDKGDFSGKELEEILNTNPLWYNSLEKEPFFTRWVIVFPPRILRFNGMEGKLTFCFY
jgi:hypothetical protein